MVRSATEIWAELSTPENLRRSREAVPPPLDVPGSGDHPLFAQADFAVTRDGPEGALAAKLIELQGFASLYAFQLVQSRELLRMSPGGERLDFYLSGLDEAGYVRVLGEAISDSLPPENVVVMDIDPPSQKTFIDFALTEQLCGVRPVSVIDIENRGSSGIAGTANPRGSCASTTGSSSTSSSRRGSRSRSTSRNLWTSPGPAIRTGTSGGASTRSRCFDTRPCPKPACFRTRPGSRAIRRTGSSNRFFPSPGRE